MLDHMCTEDSITGPLIQNEINENMRSFMNEWLLMVSERLKLQPETLYQAINILDRYLKKEQVQKKNYQAVAITALFMAAKHEEIYPPDLETFSYVTRNSVQGHDMVALEGKIFEKIDFVIKKTDRLAFF